MDLIQIKNLNFSYESKKEILKDIVLDTYKDLEGEKK